MLILLIIGCLILLIFKKIKENNISFKWRTFVKNCLIIPKILPKSGIKVRIRAFIGVKIKLTKPRTILKIPLINAFIKGPSPQSHHL